MVLESTIVCVDNSDYMRNGDFLPTRLQAQQDAVNLICHSKTRSNPENNVALLTLANTEVLVTLTSDVGRILAKLHQLQPKGDSNFTAAIRVAHLALKHRLGKNHRMRIIAFVGSPVEEDEKDLVKLAKRLKKEKVNIDIVNFGEESVNSDKLTTFVNTVNGKDGSCSHLVTVPPGPRLSDALVSSPIVVGEDGKGAIPGGVSGFDYGVDPSEDPELAMALRISMEEQRARQEQDVIKASTESAPGAVQAGTDDTTNEEALLKQALDISMQDDDDEPTSQPIASLDFDSMSEDQQIAYAMQMSLQPEASAAADSPNPMETDEAESKEKTEEKAESKEQDDEDYSEVINDPEFLQSVLENLPGVDPQSDVIRNAMGQLTKMDTDSKKDTSKKDEKK